MLLRSGDRELVRVGHHHDRVVDEEPDDPQVFLRALVVAVDPRMLVQERGVQREKRFVHRLIGGQKLLRPLREIALGGRCKISFDHVVVTHRRLLAKRPLFLHTTWHPDRTAGPAAVALSGYGWRE